MINFSKSFKEANTKLSLVTSGCGNNKIKTNKSWRLLFENRFCNNVKFAAFRYINSSLFPWNVLEQIQSHSMCPISLTVFTSRRNTDTELNLAVRLAPSRPDLIFTTAAVTPEYFYSAGGENKTPTIVLFNLLCWENNIQKCITIRAWLFTIHPFTLRVEMVPDPERKLFLDLAELARHNPIWKNFVLL